MIEISPQSARRTQSKENKKRNVNLRAPSCSSWLYSPIRRWLSADATYAKFETLNLGIPMLSACRAYRMYTAAGVPL
jgi:hypothetical protein